MIFNQFWILCLEDYSKPLSDKRINMLKLGPDYLKNEIAQLSARKSKVYFYLFHNLS